MLKLSKNEERALLAVVIILAFIIALYRFIVFKSSDVSVVEKGETPQVLEEQEKIEVEEIEPETIYVHVAGEVNNPGLYILQYGGRVGDAVSMAGGFTEEADRGSVNLAEKLRDEQFIRILKEGESSEYSVVDNNPIKSGKININTASAKELADFLPGIGEVYANNIVIYREKNGGFKSIDELTRVNGIGAKRFENIKDLVTVN